MRPGLLVALLVAAGCGGEAAAPTAGTAPSPSAAPPPLEAVVERERLYEASRKFGLTLRNPGDAPVEVSGVRLRSGLFEPVAPEVRTVTVEAGGDPVGFGVAYGPAACDRDDPALALALDVDGVATVLALGEAPPGIRRVREVECGAAAVREAADVAFSDDWQATATGGVAGTITIDRRGDAGAVVEAVDAASVVFAVEAETPLPASDDVDVVVRVGRCDAHALIESKKLFRFRVWVALDGAERVPVELEAAAGGPLRRALERALQQCVDARAPGGS